jgi:hypothetical protein
VAQVVEPDRPDHRLHPELPAVHRAPPLLLVGRGPRSDRDALLVAALRRASLVRVRDRHDLALEVDVALPEREQIALAQAGVVSNPVETGCPRVLR